MIHHSAGGVECTSGMRRFVTLALVLLLAVVGGVACTPEQTEAWTLVNLARHEEGLGLVTWDEVVAGEAQRRAEILADRDEAVHLGLGDVDEWLSPHALWSWAGENVGGFYDVHTVGEWHDAFMASPAHRAAILRPDATYVGIGHATNDLGRVFVVYLFWAGTLR